MTYNYFIGSTSGTALGTSSPYVDSNGNLIIAGLPPIAFKNIKGQLSLLTASSNYTQGVIYLDPGTPALNTDYSFWLTQPLNTTPGSTTNLDAKPTTSTYIPYNTGAYTSAPSATQVCNDIRKLLASYGVLDTANTGTATVVITATAVNPVITGFAATGSSMTVTQHTTGVQSVGYYQNMVDVGLNVARTGIIGAPVSGHTYSQSTFTVSVSGVPLAAMKTINDDIYNIFVDEADSNYAAWVVKWNALTVNCQPVDATQAVSALETDNSGAWTKCTITSTLGLAVGGFVTLSGFATHTSCNGIFRIVDVSSSTKFSIAVAWAGSTDTGTVQPLAPVI